MLQALIIDALEHRRISRKRAKIQQMTLEATISRSTLGTAFESLLHGEGQNGAQQSIFYTQAQITMTTVGFQKLLLSPHSQRL